jgi:CRP-like cAMP-binding protein
MTNGGKTILNMLNLSVSDYLFIVTGFVVVAGLILIFWRTRRGILRKAAGSDIFGVDWVIDSADRIALQKLKPLYEMVRMAPNKRVKISTALSGSAAYMGRVNPYPGDIDFTEIVLVKAAGLAEAAEIFAESLQQNIKKVLSTDHIKYSELKIGADKNSGRGLKWELDEIRKGSKLFKDQEENASERISLSRASRQRQMIKLDLIAKIEGNWKEVTKVFRFAYKPDSSRDVNDIVLLTPENLGETIYQELYFKRSEAKLAAKISKVSEKGGYSHPRVLKKYRDMMDVEIAHYGALGMADRVSHLKLLKRWFNKLRMDHDHASIDKLTEIFRSNINAVNELKEMMALLALAVQKKLLTSQEIGDQLRRFDDLLFEHGTKIPEEDVRSCRLELRIIRDQIDQGKWVECAVRLRSLISMLEDWIEEKAKIYLLNEILHPHAERLGIRVNEDASFERKDLFRGVTKGDKTHYLVNRYLRYDSRVVKRKFKKEETIIRLGDEAVCCYVILDGSAAVFDPREGLTSHHVRDVGPMTFIGEIALIHEGKKRTANIVAKTEVEALEIPRDVFLELMQDRSFRLFIEFLSTDRLMEDGTRFIREQSPYNLNTQLRGLKSSIRTIFKRQNI